MSSGVSGLCVLSSIPPLCFLFPLHTSAFIPRFYCVYCVALRSYCVYHCVNCVYCVFLRSLRVPTAFHCVSLRSIAFPCVPCVPLRFLRITTAFIVILLCLRCVLCVHPVFRQYLGCLFLCSHHSLAVPQCSFSFLALSTRLGTQRPLTPL